MTSAIILKPGEIVVSDLPKPEAGEGEVLIRVRASGICGTDLHIYAGEYMGSYPIVPGHEFSGDVVETGKGVSRVAAGDRVAVEPNIACGKCDNCLSNRQNFCLNWSAVGVTRPGGMAELVVVPEENVFPVGDLDYKTAAFVEPLSCVLHGLGKLKQYPGDRVCILGAGPIGCLLLMCARLSGAAEVILVERNGARRELAATLGADSVHEESRAVGDESCDIVIDASGAIPLMLDSTRIARKGGQILLFGVPRAGDELTLRPFVLFEKGLQISSSFTSVRNSLQAVSLLRSGRISVEKLVSHTYPLRDLEKAITSIQDGVDGVMKVLIEP
jgi:D-arabinitol dehydrogenase (NADP+)